MAATIFGSVAMAMSPTLGAAASSLFELDVERVSREADGLVAGDFDRDGRRDLVVGSTDLQGSPGVWFLRGRGGGRFARPLRSFVAHGVSPQVAGDFNRDRRLDVAGVGYCAACVDPNGWVWVGLGDGRGRFRTGFAGADELVSEVAALEFNGDGRVDLAAITPLIESIHVFAGSAGGRFDDRLRSISFAGDGPVLTGDVNGDGRSDLITSGYRSTLSIIADGAGHFGFRDVPMTAPSGMPFHAHALADLNGDRRSDAIGSVVEQSLDTGLMTALADGSGGFGSVVPQALIGEVEKMGAGDIDGDGSIDVAAIGGRELMVFPGDGRGGLGSPTYLPSGLTNSASLLISDLTGDHRADVVAAGPYLGGELLMFRSTRRRSARGPADLAVSPRTSLDDRRSCYRFDVRLSRRTATRAILRFAHIRRKIRRSTTRTVCLRLRRGIHQALLTANGRTIAATTIEVGSATPRG